jgi:threonine aldolase
LVYDKNRTVFKLKFLTSEALSDPKKKSDYIACKKSMEVNLISDTVTKPGKEMLEAMFAASVGDDVFGEDPTVKALEAKVATMFGYEAAVYCPSGTMTNQIAIKVHTRPLDELVCEENSHVYQYEVGGYAFHSGIALQLIKGVHGKLQVEQVKSAVRPEYDWLPRTRLVVLENTANRAGGSYYTNEEIRPISEFCRCAGLAIHLDGARIFNALVASGDTAIETGSLFDSISVCLSKGLGAPVGSVLAGSRAFVAEARRVRKVMGGGMRQAGYLAAACIYALDNNVERLTIDHQHARILADTLSQCTFVKDMRPVKTNIIIFDLEEGMSAERFIELMRAKDIRVSGFGPQTIRMVTHLDVSASMIDYVCGVLREI